MLIEVDLKLFYYSPNEYFFKRRLIDTYSIYILNMFLDDQKSCFDNNLFWKIYRNHFHSSISWLVDKQIDFNKFRKNIAEEENKIVEKDELNTFLTIKKRLSKIVKFYRYYSRDKALLYKHKVDVIGQLLFRIEEVFLDINLITDVTQTICQLIKANYELLLKGEFPSSVIFSCSDDKKGSISKSHLLKEDMSLCELGIDVIRKYRAQGTIYTTLKPSDNFIQKVKKEAFKDVKDIFYLFDFKQLSSNLIKIKKLNVHNPLNKYSANMIIRKNSLLYEIKINDNLHDFYSEDSIRNSDEALCFHILLKVGEELIKLAQEERSLKNV